MHFLHIILASHPNTRLSITPKSPAIKPFSETAFNDYTAVNCCTAVKYKKMGEFPISEPRALLFPTSKLEMTIHGISEFDCLNIYSNIRRCSNAVMNHCRATLHPAPPSLRLCHIFSAGFLSTRSSWRKTQARTRRQRLRVENDISRTIWHFKGRRAIS